MFAVALAAASLVARAPAPSSELALSLESKLLSLTTRGAGAAAIEPVVAALVEEGDNVDAPALSPLLEGRWKLLYSSRSRFDPANPLGSRVDGTAPGVEGWFRALSGGSDAGGNDGGAMVSSSPIQRAFIEAFAVRQDILFDGGTGSDGAPRRPRRVEQFVETPAGRLMLRAAASASAEEPARLRFTFDEGYFETGGGAVRLPYPVPFRLLGDEAKGWLDTSYLSEELRVSAGNKGTTFVLQRLR